MVRPARLQRLSAVVSVIELAPQDAIVAMAPDRERGGIVLRDAAKIQFPSLLAPSLAESAE